MKTFYMFLPLGCSVAAQTTTNTPPTQSTSLSITTPALSTTTVSVWLNITSGAPFTATPNGVNCGTTGLVLDCTSSAVCDGIYNNIFYQYGSDFFASEFGHGGINATANFESTQSCTLVPGESSSSYFSCRGAYTTSYFPNPSNVQTSATTSTFTWPTTEMVSTGLAISTSLQYLSATASCTRSAATKTLDRTNALALEIIFGAALLYLLL